MIRVALNVENDIQPVALSVSNNNPAVNLEIETVITRIPSNYGLITWNGSYLLVS